MYTVSEQLAYDRGKVRGQIDESMNHYDDSPLSGEWAGYSIVELIGDLFPEDGEDGDPSYWDIHRLCELYEEGYRSAFDDRVFCDGCGTLVNPNDGVTDDVFVYCGSMFGNGCAEKMVA